MIKKNRNIIEKKYKLIKLFKKDLLGSIVLKRKRGLEII